MRRTERRMIAAIAAVAACMISAFPAGATEEVFSHSGGAGKKIALTFDDGPHRSYTEEILDVLSSYGVRATFFVIGENVCKYPEIVQREVSEGHEIGNHTYDHKSLSKASYDEAKDQIKRAQTEISNAVGLTPTLFRPPEGRVGDGCRRAAEDLGYSVILWSVDTKDWTNIGADRIIGRALKATDGDIILCHDFISGESHTAEALRVLIPELQARGYEFVTVSELLGSG